MFSDIIGISNINEIKKYYKERGRESTIIKLKQVIEKLRVRHNKYTLSLTIDSTLLCFCKLQKKLKERQKGLKQLDTFTMFLFEDFSEIKIQNISTDVIDLMSNLEQDIYRLKDRITAILEVLASFAGLIIAIVAIVLSVVSIACR